MEANKINLKKRRGLLYAQIADAISIHDQEKQNHVAGSLPARCPMCKRLVQLRQELNVINQQLAVSGLVDIPKDHLGRFYLVLGNNGLINIIRAQNSDTALKLAAQINHTRQVKPVSDDEAFHFIQIGDEMNGHEKI